LCIARKFEQTRRFALTWSKYVDRLRTIIGYDRICVMDAGMIAVRLHVFKLLYSALTIHPGIRYPS
jgi:hypothetical protein